MAWFQQVNSSAKEVGLSSKGVGMLAVSVWLVWAVDV